VAEGRQLKEEQVMEIAQGRVWSGQDAIEIGLVDELGALDDAIAYAVNKADVEEYKLVAYPKPKNKFDELREIFDISARAERTLKKELGTEYQYYRLLKDIKALQEPQMRMPYSIEIE